MITERIGTSLSPGSLDLFLKHAKDAGNWSGTPLLGSGLELSQEDKGHLTDLKRKKLISTERSDGCDWVHFEPAGLALAAAHGITIETF